ncbi:MAG: GGDEF domain-containing protein [Clostridia bacterium]|nr:GGDEF domain-containing protein [Clostridia bacterium]
MIKKLKKSGFALMQLQVALWLKILITLAIMGALILLVFLYDIPNPNMILIAGLVLCSSLFGFGGGIIAGVVMFAYTLYFFSTGNDFKSFTDQNIQKVIVSFIGIFADMIFVCLLKRAELKAFKKVNALTEELKKDNEKLLQISLTDALTGIRNRMALRDDFDSFVGHEISVMMLDVDNFKSFNDNLGHECGDKILKETGSLLAKHFGREHCYRYGGDEFLVIYPDSSLDEFGKKIGEFTEERPSLNVNGKIVSVSYSYGFIHDKIDERDRLRALFSAADKRMYEDKKTKAAQTMC